METEVSETGRIHRGILDGGRGAVEMDDEETQKISHKDKQSYTRAESSKREHKLYCHIYHVTSENNITSV